MQLHRNFFEGSYIETSLKTVSFFISFNGDGKCIFNSLTALFNLGTSFTVLHPKYFKVAATNYL